MLTTHIRPAAPSDVAPLSALRAALWPESSQAQHARELDAILGNRAPRVFPLVIFVAEQVMQEVAQENSAALIGFLEAGLRSCADGCDESRPVGYVEGWFVAERHRRHGVGAALLRAAEAWAREQGCREMASDASIDNELSQRVHELSGFTVTARSVLYRRAL